MLIYADPKKLKNLLTRVYTSPYSDFYLDIYKTSSIEASPSIRKDFLDTVLKEDTEWDIPKAQDVLKHIPLLHRKDITRVHPKKRTYVPDSEIEFISYTSGTSDGKPLVIQWSHVNTYFFDPSLGLPVSKPLVLHPALNKNFGHTFIQQCRQSSRKLSPVFADYQQLPQSAILAEETSIDSIYTTPTLAEHLYGHLSKRYDTLQIKLLVLFSETLTKTKRDILKRMYPSAHIANVYASSEIGQILFFPTPEEIQSDKEHMHILKDAVVAVELIEDELVITMEQNEAFPLIRYATGDYFEYSESDDSLRWKGRNSIDVLKINGIEIRIEDVEKAISYCSLEIGPVYQLHFYSHMHESKSNEQIRIVVETIVQHPTTFAKEEAKEKIKDTLMHMWHLTSSATLEDAIHKGLVSDLEIRFVDSLSTQGTKSRKLVSHF